MVIKFFGEFDSQNEGIKNKLISGLAALSMLISSCQSITPEEKSKLEKEIEVLNKKEEDSQKSLDHVYQEITSKKNTIDSYNQQIKDLEIKLGIIKSGKQPRYILKLKFQEHKLELSMDRIDFTFEIPVDEEFYNESAIGSRLGKGSRLFSLGHGGDIKITDKRIVGE